MRKAWHLAVLYGIFLYISALLLSCSPAYYEPNQYEIKPYFIVKLYEYPDGIYADCVDGEEGKIHKWVYLGHKTFHKVNDEIDFPVKR